MVELKNLRAAAFAWACAALLACGGAAAADTVLPPVPLSFIIAPAITVPPRPGAQYFLPGGSAELAVEYALPALPLLSLGGDLSYGFTPIAGGSGTTSQFAALLGAAWRVPIVGRLSVRAFARAGLGLGLVHGDPLSGPGGSPLVEAGVGLSYTVNPAAVARLDTSYLLLLGGNGTFKVSIGLSVRPRLSAAAPKAGRAASPRASVEIGEVSLESVYPVLRRSYHNRPAGKVVIRNAGKGSLTDLHVSLRVKGFMDGLRESAVRAQLKPGRLWEAPLVVVLGPVAADQKAASAQGEVVVTWVEQGEPWEARTDTMLRIMEPHVIGADDLRKEAAFVLPSDPSVRGLSAAIAAAIPPSTESGADPVVSAAIAVREALRLLGIRITGGSDNASADGEGAPIRRVKYPPETLRDLSGTSVDVAVLCASLLEAAVKAALIDAKGRALVAVGQDDAGEGADAPQPGKDSVVDPDGHRWLPFEVDRIDEAFLDAVAAGVKAWNASQAAGTGSLAAVREAWRLYPPSAYPQADFKAPAIPAKQLADAVQAAIAVFLGKGPARGQATAAVAAQRPPRRLLVVFEPHPAAAYSEIQRASLADSLALSMQRADTGVLVIPYGGTDFPSSTDKRVDAARGAGADCYVVVELSGEGPSSVITAESFDIISRSSAIAPATVASASNPGESPDWGPVIKLVADTYGKSAAAAAR